LIISEVPLPAAPSILRLIPLNPILLRVVTAAGRRFFHALVRWGYLALLIAVLLISLIGTSSGMESNLTTLAKASTQVFKYISYVQLAMICLLAPIFTASAITQERDSRTYNILLATPLSNGQIVLGSLLSRLYFVIALLLSGVPVFAITLFYGGVTAQNIALSFAIALSTGLFTGSLAITIAVTRLGTSKTVFWFYVGNAVYLVGLYFIDNALSAGTTTWLTGIHPFLALKSVVNPTAYPTPDAATVANHTALVRWYLMHPASAYLVFTLTLSVLMVAASATFLRRISQRSEGTLWETIRLMITRGKGERGRRSRPVWTNPVAWREGVTRAGMSGRGLARWGTIVVGVAAALGLEVALFRGHLFVPFHAPEARQLLTGLITLEFIVTLLVATNSAASAVTKERETRTLDQLLVTPITSRYYIWGKLRGLVSFMLPFAAVPTLTIMIVIIGDIVRGEILNQPIVLPETLIEMPIVFISLSAFAAMLGLQLSLKWTRTLVAIMSSLGILASICAALGVCGFATAAGVEVVGPVIGAFSPLTSLALMIDPYVYASKSFGLGGTFDPATPSFIVGRIVLFIALMTASGVYCLITWGMYKSMVKNFDMTIRRQNG
jgi:ABC-type transport system involved in multi-copper enzyme maturation permease subunit